MQLALAPVQNLFNSYATISSGTGMRQQYKTLIFTALAAAISFGHANAADDDLGFLFEDDSDSQVEVEPAESPAAEDEGQQANDATQPDDSDTAASETEEADAPVASGEKRLILEEIVVTAQKRAQVLADVPVSLTAISGEKLTDAGIENLSDMSEYTPNFKLVDSGLIPNIYMRGVGSGSNQGFELSVGMFSDGIHLGRPHQTRAAFMDVQRVEVLRGPQSILFGKNAIAGALNIISATPGDEFESILSGSLGLPHQDAEISAVISGPINDQFGARLAVRQRGENGYIYNRAQGRDEPSTDELATRGTFTWAPSDAFDSSLKLEHTRRVQNGRTFQPTDPGALTGCSGEETNFDLSRNTNEAERAVIEAYNATLNVSIPVGESTLTVVTGASGFDSSDLYDADASEFDTIYLLGDEFYDQVSTEIRFASPIGNFVDYIFGVFYQQGDLLFNEFGPLIARAGALGD
ncbi:MAG: iron complex outermembrane receptor protein, partial [Pseudoalteromonas tetraodonis]